MTARLVERTNEQVERAGFVLICRCGRRQPIGMWAVAHINDRGALPLKGKCAKCGAEQHITDAQKD
jgi:hypothetical protein